MSNAILLFGACLAALQLVFVEIKDLKNQMEGISVLFYSVYLSKDGGGNNMVYLVL